ncbi:unnamed protein product [Symbiodinium sp. CCMP2592]|nr:unnamed protein product [Symbiodinium sp. CCMP2592]
MVRDKGNSQGLQFEDLLKLLPPDAYQPQIARRLTSFAPSQKLTLGSPDPEIWQNATGLSTQLVFDITFLLCLARVQAQQAAGGEPRSDINDGDIKMLVGASGKISPRLRLAMRTAQSIAVARAQQACSEEQLVKRGQQAQADMQRLESLLQDALRDHDLAPGISLKPLSVTKKVMGDLPSEAEDTVTELRTSLAAQLSKVSSLALSLAASLTAGIGNLDDLVSWCDGQFTRPDSGFMFEPLSESKAFAWEQAGLLQLQVVNFNDADDRALVKGLMSAWAQLRELKHGEEEAKDLDTLMLKLSKYVTTVDTWGEKSLDACEGVPDFFRKMLPPLRNLASRMMRAGLESAKAKVFEQRPDIEKMQAVVLFQLDCVILNVEKQQIPSAEQTAEQYHAAVAAFKLNSDLLAATGQQGKVDNAFNDFKSSLEDLLETCNMNLETLRSLSKNYECRGCDRARMFEFDWVPKHVIFFLLRKILEASAAWNTAAMEELLALPNFETDMDSLQDTAGATQKECAELAALSGHQVGPEEWLQLFAKLGDAVTHIKEAGLHGATIHVSMTFAELLLHPGKYDLLPALEETGKVASRMGVADKMPAQLASRVKRAVAELKAKTTAPSNPSDGKQDLKIKKEKKEKKKDKDKGDKKHKHDNDKEGSAKKAKK